MYEIIEKNQYGVLVRNTINSNRCINCKYYEDSVLSLPCRICIKNVYYLTDSEAEKLESETSDTQKELIDLHVELRVEKEKNKALEEYSRGLELKVKELENQLKYRDFMIENGLGDDNMKNDITMPNERFRIY